MRKILSLALAALMIVSAFAFVSCGEKAAKLGLGVATTVSATNATEEKAGSVKTAATVAAVLLSTDGKIISVDIDTLEAALGMTATGEAVAASSLLSKRDKGDAYNMVKFGGATLEWYAQVDALETVLVGKTIEEAKALLLETGYGADAVVAAGCTIAISDMIEAVLEACANAKEVGSFEGDSVAVSVVCENSKSTANATAEKAGVLQAEFTFAAVSVKDGKTTAVITDAMNAKATFSTTGEAISTAEPQTKGELKEGYGMAQYANTTEYYLQSAAFDKECAGKTSAEITAMENGTDALVAAGCTIAVSPLVAAVVKAIAAAK